MNVIHLVHREVPVSFLEVKSMRVHGPSNIKIRFTSNLKDKNNKQVLIDIDDIVKLAIDKTSLLGKGEPLHWLEPAISQK